MNPLFRQFSQQLETLTARAELRAVLEALEDSCDAFADIDQQVADRLIATLDQRLAAHDALAG